MHESTMSVEQLDRLKKDVFAFYEKFKQKTVTLQDAKKHFESLGYTLTRPIEHTLQAYGVVERPDRNLQIWPFSMADQYWQLRDSLLQPQG